jgi:hypothetical protein
MVVDLEGPPADAELPPLTAEQLATLRERVSALLSSGENLNGALAKLPTETDLAGFGTDGRFKAVWQEVQAEQQAKKKRGQNTPKAPPVDPEAAFDAWPGNKSVADAVQHGPHAIFKLSEKL